MNKITVSAPCKVHLLGEHAVVYGKPAIITSVDLRVTAIISQLTTSKVGFLVPSEPVLSEVEVVEGDSFLGDEPTSQVRKVIEPIIKKHLKLKKIPPYQIDIQSDAPIGSHLGTSAAISATYIAALLSFLKVKWDLKLVNQLTYEAEKTFQGNPSGGDNSTVVFGGLIWFRKESEELKIIQSLPFSIPPKLARNFIFINTGKPKEITAAMVKKVKQLYLKKPKIVENFLDNQERLVRELLPVIKDGKEKELIRIIKEGERNLESIGVASKEVVAIIRIIETNGGAAKICGAGSDSGPTGVLLAYHPDKKKLLNLIKSFKLPYFSAELGVEGLKNET